MMMKNGAVLLGQLIFISAVFFSCRKNEENSDLLGVSSVLVNEFDIHTLKVGTGTPFGKDSLMLFEFFLNDENSGARIFEFLVKDIPRKVGTSKVFNVNDLDIPAAYFISLDDDIMLDYYYVLESEVNEFEITRFHDLAHEIHGRYNITFVVDTLLPKVGGMADTIRIRDGRFIAFLR